MNKLSGKTLKLRIKQPSQLQSKLQGSKCKNVPNSSRFIPQNQNWITSLIQAQQMEYKIKSHAKWKKQSRKRVLQQTYEDNCKLYFRLQNTKSQYIRLFSSRDRFRQLTKRKLKKLSTKGSLPTLKNKTAVFSPSKKTQIGNSKENLKLAIKFRFNREKFDEANSAILAKLLKPNLTERFSTS